MSNSGRPALSYGDAPRPKLEPDDVNGGPAVLTVKSAERRNFAPRGQPQEYKLVLVFGEKFDPKSVRDADPSTEREFVCNATDYKTLCAKLGSDEATWPGRRCVVAMGTTKFRGEDFEKLMIATPDRWEKVLAAATKASSKAATK